MFKKFFIGLVVCLGLIGIFSVSGTKAANDTANTPIRIDTFTGDVAVHAGDTYVENITITAYTSAKTIVFIDDDGNNVLILECPAGYTITWPPAGQTAKEFSNGLNLDQSESELAAGDYVFIWLSRGRK